MSARPGYILMEAVVTCLILSFSIVALMPIFAMSIKGNSRSERRLVAAHLASALMEEIKLRRQDETSRAGGSVYAGPGSAVLGVDPGEDRADKRTFDDVDDFDGWSEDPPLDPVMRPLSEFKGYQRAVAVRYVHEDLSASLEPTDYKQATVCVKYQDATQTCFDRLFVNR